MKRLAMPVLLFIALLIFASSGPAWALDPVEIGVEIHAGWSDFSNPDSDNNLDSHPIGGIGLEARSGPLSLELSADWIKTDVKKDLQFSSSSIGIAATAKGQLTIIPILLTGRYHIGAKEGVIDPYIGIGGGLYLLSFDPGSTVYGIIPKSPNSLSQNINYHNTAGFHVNLGFDIHITPVLALTLDSRYVWAGSQITYNDKLAGFNTGNDTLRLDSWVTTFGIKYYFKN